LSCRSETRRSGLDFLTRNRFTENALKITLFVPCFVDQLYPGMAISMVHVLERLGHEVEFPGDQTCCGQPAFNTGYWDEARDVALHFIKVFSKSEVIVAPSGSCPAMIRNHYSELFHGCPEAPAAASVVSRVFEFTEFLVDKLHVTDLGARFEGRVTWHDACHTNRGLGIHHQPRQLLRAVKGLELVEMKGCEVCCGFGGTFSVKFPAVSSAMVGNKATSIEESGAQYVSSCDPSCLMNIGGLLAKRNSPVKPIYIAEILDSR
jgi:L-lactate dehydrogenase complex protein LldE